MPEQPIYDPKDEKELLREVSEGNELAFTELVMRYSGLLYTYLLKLTRHDALAEDVVQEIFTQIWLTRENLMNVRNFRSFLFVISRNYALRVLKNMSREDAAGREWSSLHQMVTEKDDRINDQLGLVEQAVCRLSPQQQKAWVLSRRKGLKYQEIAEEMKISRETVKKYLQHATASITEYLKLRGST